MSTPKKFISASYNSLKFTLPDKKVYFCSKEVIFMDLCAVEINFLAMDKIFCPGQKVFCPGHYLFVRDKIYFVWDKIYFVRADGMGIKLGRVLLISTSESVSFLMNNTVIQRHFRIFIICLFSHMLLT